MVGDNWIRCVCFNFRFQYLFERRLVTPIFGIFIWIDTRHIHTICMSLWFCRRYSSCCHYVSFSLYRRQLDCDTHSSTSLSCFVFLAFSSQLTCYERIRLYWCIKHQINFARSMDKLIRYWVFSHQIDAGNHADNTTSPKRRIQTGFSNHTNTSEFTLFS